MHGWSNTKRVVVSIDAMLRDGTSPVAALAGPAGGRCVIAGSASGFGASSKGAAFLRTRSPLGRLIVLCEVSGEICLFGQVDGHFQHSKRDPLLEPVLVNAPRRR
jgi:hypothetical protein